MSRNGNFNLHSPLGSNPHMGTAYGPSAENGAEGDVLYGLREDDANLRLGVSAYDELKGLREDDANLRLGGLREDDANLRLGVSAYDLSDGASGSAEGSAEGNQMAVSAYDMRGMQPRMLVSNGRMGGLVEDHYDIKMDGLREDDANVRMGVSAYDLNGLREDDANVRLGVSAYDLNGLREDDANLRLGRMRADEPLLGTAYGPNAENGAEGDILYGLREDDANLRLGTAYDPDAAGSAEDPSSRAGMGVSAYDLQGLREDDANVRLGISAYDLGDVDSLNAEAGAIEQEQTLADHEVGKGKGMKIRNVARNSARIAFQRAKGGQITSYAEASQLITERTRTAGEKMKQILDTRRGNVDKVVADAVDKALAEWGPKITNVLSKKATVSGVRMGYILRGLREDDANVSMGRFRAPHKMHRQIQRKMLRGAEGTPPEMMNATGFHERFPVTVDIAGLGRINGTIKGGHIDGLFDFLSKTATPEEYLGKLRVVADQWSRIKPRLDRLAPSANAAIQQNMNAADSRYGDYDQAIPQYLAEGYAGYTAVGNSARWNRAKRWEAYIPTLDKLVSQAEVLGTAYTPQQANADALKNVSDRANAAGGESFLSQAAPVAAGVAGVGLLTALILAIAA
jgi:hypothetical protein